MSGSDRNRGRKGSVRQSPTEEVGLEHYEALKRGKGQEEAGGLSRAEGTLGPAQVGPTHKPHMQTSHSCAHLRLTPARFHTSSPPGKGCQQLLIPEVKASINL